MRFGYYVQPHYEGHYFLRITNSERKWLDQQGQADVAAGRVLDYTVVPLGPVAAPVLFAPREGAD